MKVQYACGLVLLMFGLAVSGCFGGDGNGGSGTNPTDLDESATYDHAIANDGFQTRGSVSSGESVALGTTPTGDASAVELKVVDMVSSDEEGAEDKADFVLDASVTGGSRYQAAIRSMLTGDLAGLDGDHQGGVAQNTQVFGSTGLGPAEFPETKGYITVLGQARLRVDGETLEGRHTFFAAVTKAVHDADGGVMSSVSNDSLELHVYFPGRTLGSDFAIPGVAGESLYFYLTNVQLKMLGTAAKAGVGTDLAPPEIPNEPPAANITVLVDGVPADNATLDVQANEGNLTLTLDGSNSTDADGEISIYSWEVREFKNNTSIEKIFSGQGEEVSLNVSKPGWKLITLRVIDDRFEPAEAQLLFFVNYKNTYTHAFEGANSVGAGQSCNDPINCHDHFMTVVFGAQAAEFTLTPDGQCSTPHIDVYAPGPTPGESGDQVGSGGNSLTLEQEAVAAIGQYQIQVWFQAQVACSYSLEVNVDYSNPQQAD